LTAASVGCVSVVTCPVAAGALVVWLQALDKWQVALDKLTDCIAYNKMLTASLGGGGGSDPYGPSGPHSSDDPDGYYSTNVTVEQFIDDAIASGNYACSGDSCVYYAE
jgi:hypothetical protein